MLTLRESTQELTMIIYKSHPCHIAVCSEASQALGLFYLPFDHWEMVTGSPCVWLMEIRGVRPDERAEGAVNRLTNCR